MTISSATLLANRFCDQRRPLSLLQSLPVKREGNINSRRKVTPIIQDLWNNSLRSRYTKKISNI